VKVWPTLGGGATLGTVLGSTFGCGTLVDMPLGTMCGTTLISGTVVWTILWMVLGGTVGAGNACWKGVMRVCSRAKVGDALGSTDGDCVCWWNMSARCWSWVCWLSNT
jgi:hypothetical protein